MTPFTKRRVPIIQKIILMTYFITTASKVVQSQQSITLHPFKHESQIGSHSSDQNVLVLSKKNNLVGTQDGWKTYIEFYPITKGDYEGYFIFDISSENEIMIGDGWEADFEAKVKGPTKNDDGQTWRFDIFNTQTQIWESMVDNSGINSWRWSEMIKTGMSIGKFVDVNNKQIKIRLYSESENGFDNFNVDFMELKLRNPNSFDQTLIEPLDTWTYDLAGKLLTPYTTKVVMIDMEDTTSEEIDTLKNDGKTVCCYFSAGSYEDWRSDKDDFTEEIKGSKMDGWEELWIDTRSDKAREIMTNRIKRAKDRGCHAVEPDNVDGYDNDTGFDIKKEESRDYLIFLANKAHEEGLLIALKNTPDLVLELHSQFDFSIVEECDEYNECNKYSPFANSKKAVFAVEYNTPYDESLCKTFASYGFSLIFANYELTTQTFCDNSKPPPVGKCFKYKNENQCLKGCCSWIDGTCIYKKNCCGGHSKKRSCKKDKSRCCLWKQGKCNERNKCKKSALV